MRVQSYSQTNNPREFKGHYQHGDVELVPISAFSMSPLKRSHTVSSTSTDFTKGSSPTNYRPGSWLDGSVTSSSSRTEINDIKCDVMVNYLHQQQRERLWMSSNASDQGVVLKKTRGRYTCCPENLGDIPSGLMRAIEAMNVRVALTVGTKVIQLFLLNCRSDSIPLSNGLRLQVLQDITHLPRCQKHQFAAFILDRELLIVWDDDPRQILNRATKIESELLEMIWQDEPVHSNGSSSKKSGVTVHSAEVGSDTVSDLEANTDTGRPLVLWQPISVALTITCLIAALGVGCRAIVIEISIDHNWARFAFLFLWPTQVWFSLVIAANFVQVVGPVNQINKNSKFFSGIRPKRITRGPLPHVTIQMPVHKESLSTVIEPTVKSIKTAISTYEMQGGTANIFVNDDGMQLIGTCAAQVRKDFYDEHNIGWVARPEHRENCMEGDVPFLRRGKFKKASNMNYALWISARVENILLLTKRTLQWSTEDEAAVYVDALAQVVTEDGGRTWAEGNIRVGDYILIVDCDTRVPRDCFLDAVSEMEQSPDVAILQFLSGVINITDTFFEHAITFFTNLIYTQIRFVVANGDVAPFVGHNAFLRWSAIQQIAYDCADDHREKWWSEATVSEDFDMALRLQSIGYTVRLGAYMDNGFQEGVSLTVYDELARWEKYAFGCSELIFHPVKQWLTRGPFTPLFRRFITSRIPLTSKVTTMAYVGTYYAIASSWLLTVANYFLVGWFNGSLDHYYVDSFKLFFSVTVVFTAFGNVALAVHRYRIKEKELVAALIEVFKWVPLLAIFFAGISLHLSRAILNHMLSIDMSWGATVKEVENITFFEEISKVLKTFRFTFLFWFACLVGMLALAFLPPVFWQIRLFIAVWPMGVTVFGHLMLPIVLNPSLMRFTW